MSQAHVTRANEIKGKLTYMAPEQLLGKSLTRKADIFSAGIMLWETLTGHRLFYGDNDGAIIRRILEDPIPAPSTLNAAVSPGLDAVVLRALDRDPSRRFDTAEEMASRIEEATPVASPRTIGIWVKENADSELRARADLIARVEGNCVDAALEDDISRSRPVVTRTPRASDDGEPPALAQALLALDAQRRQPPPRSWARRLVPALVVAVIVGGGGFALWRRSAAPSLTSSPKAGDDPAITVTPLTVPPSSAPRAGTPAASSAPVCGGERGSVVRRVVHLASAARGAWGRGAARGAAHRSERVAIGTRDSDGSGTSMRRTQDRGSPRTTATTSRPSRVPRRRACRTRCFGSSSSMALTPGA